jgi:hypothetical protein
LKSDEAFQGVAAVLLSILCQSIAVSRITARSLSTVSREPFCA